MKRFESSVQDDGLLSLLVYCTLFLALPLKRTMSLHYNVNIVDENLTVSGYYRNRSYFLGNPQLRQFIHLVCAVVVAFSCFVKFIKITP